MKFYQTRAFRELSSKWRERLKKSGFDDLECEREKLRQKNIRTQNWESRDHILDFHLLLNEYLTLKTLPRKHRRILELYSDGYYIKEIVERTGLSDRWVRMIIQEYKLKITEGDEAA